MNTISSPLVPCVLGAALVALGCGGPQANGGGTNAGGQTGGAAPGEPMAAYAVIEPKSGTNTSGMAELTSDGKTVTLNLGVSGATPGELAVHIHEKPDCSSPDAESAGGHWNPTMEAHGKFGDKPFHLGDIGNISIGEDGKGSLTHTTDLWSLTPGAPNSVLDHAIVVHISKDDFKTQPGGGAGARIGCGVIKRK